MLNLKRHASQVIICDSRAASLFAYTLSFQPYDDDKKDAPWCFLFNLHWIAREISANGSMPSSLNRVARSRLARSTIWGLSISSVLKKYYIQRSLRVRDFVISYTSIEIMWIP